MEGEDFDYSKPEPFKCPYCRKQSWCMNTFGKFFKAKWEGCHHPDFIPGAEKFIRSASEQSPVPPPPPPLEVRR